MKYQNFPLIIPSTQKCAEIENYVRRNFMDNDIIHTTWDKNTGETLVYPYQPPHDYPITIYTAHAKSYSGDALKAACQAWADAWTART